MAKCKTEKKIKGMTHREWQILIQLIHKFEVNYEDKKRGRKSNSQMDKIIRDSVIWENVHELEDKVRKVCFEFDN
ncbi:hypothetical protein LCGC14_2774430 [marine sediment metagenome]|uniref:Uncharacterized protein n=1 Tax=marine sediment metagenome TaxID=412755 RepID=A0A0F9BLP9_9ZZZZ